MLKPISRIASLLLTMTLAASTVSCSSDDDKGVTDGKCHVVLSVSTSAQFGSRALDENDWRDLSKYTVEVTDDGGNVIHSFKADAVPSDIEVESGVYAVHAWCGEYQPASRTTFLSEAVKEFTVNIKDETSVELLCVPTCGKVSVVYGDGMTEYFDDYYVTFNTPAMGAGIEATWAKTDTEPWYLAVSENGDNVTATIHLKAKADYTIDKDKDGADWSEGTVTRTYKLERNKAWTLSIDPKYTSSNGELGVSITIDDTTVDHDVEVVIPSEWI